MRRAAACLAALLLIGGASFSAGAATELVTVGSAAVQLAADSSSTVSLPVHLSAVPAKVDAMVLLDISGSMARQLVPVEQAVTKTLTDLAGDGLDLNAGVAVAGTTPSGSSADPATDADNPSYTAPVPFRRVLPISPLATALPVLTAVRSEVYPTTGDFAYNDREQAQLLGIHQLLTGEGRAGTLKDNLQDAVPVGQVAGWRTDATRVLIDVTDQPFSTTQGVSIAQTAQELVAQHVHHVGLMAYGLAQGVRDEGALSRATGDLSPGVACGGTSGTDEVALGAPLVCSTTSAGAAIRAAVAGLRPDAPLRLAAVNDPVVTALRPSIAGLLNGGTAHALQLSADVRCPASTTASRHAIPIQVSWFGRSATGILTVECAASSALVPPPRAAAPDPVALPQPAPPPAPVAPAPVPPPAAGPAAVVQPGLAAQPNLSLTLARQQEEVLAQIQLLVAGGMTSAALLVAWRWRQQLERSRST